MVGTEGRGLSFSQDRVADRSSHDSSTPGGSCTRFHRCAPLRHDGRHDRLRWPHDRNRARRSHRPPAGWVVRGLRATGPPPVPFLPDGAAGCGDAGLADARAARAGRALGCRSLRSHPAGHGARSQGAEAAGAGGAALPAARGRGGVRAAPRQPDRAGARPVPAPGGAGPRPRPHPHDHRAGRTTSQERRVRRRDPPTTAAAGRRGRPGRSRREPASGQPRRVDASPGVLGPTTAAAPSAGAGGGL